jgi:Na+-transporting NADH:ubiquinone oxidoreductase subunit NqrC
MIAFASPLTENNKMTAIITSYNEVIETRIVDQATGDTIDTTYHSNVNAAIAHADEFNPNRVEFEELY